MHFSLTVSFRPIFDRCHLLPVEPGGGIAYRLLVELEAQPDVRALCSITRQAEVIVFVAGPVVPGAQPEVGGRAEADGQAV